MKRKAVYVAEFITVIIISSPLVYIADMMY